MSKLGNWNLLLSLGGRTNINSLYFYFLQLCRLIVDQIYRRTTLYFGWTNRFFTYTYTLSQWFYLKFHINSMIYNCILQVYYLLIWLDIIFKFILFLVCDFCLATRKSVKDLNSHKKEHCCKFCSVFNDFEIITKFITLLI